MMAMVAAGVAAAANAEGVRQREVNQQQRIGQGVSRGSLTSGETRRLERQEGALHREIRRDSISGGHLGPAERAHIQRQENRLSGEIHRLKHNGRVQ
jgi:hypothetical protein